MDNNTQNPQKSTALTSSQLAMRVGSEFFSGIIVGVVFGYGIDHIFGTKPWGMVVMILLGFMAGFRNIFKLFSLGQSTTDPVELNQNGGETPDKISKDSSKEEGNSHG